MDKALSTPYDFQTAATKNITLYAKSKKLPEEIKTGKINIKYQVENGKETHNSNSVTGNVGDIFNLKEKYLFEIPNYKYVKTVDTSEGKFSEETQEVIYVYKY
ncbi:hypothetical protein CBF29_01310 [Vagococcus elongatus]|uniref:MucBP domain-containing protein n=1 Tax=Vagococcus elongatus TaxID=180344 RepID=A0A430B651_9ENTE|nr:hypothetical protein CBF29_01310 [Vagococcus elongatus]